MNMFKHLLCYVAIAASAAAAAASVFLLQSLCPSKFTIDLVYSTTLVGVHRPYRGFCLFQFAAAAAGAAFRLDTRSSHARAGRHTKVR